VKNVLPVTQRHMLGFVKLGASRTFVACSNRVAVGEQCRLAPGRATKVTPIGSRPEPPVPYPAGTVSTG